jgi:tripartite-type tricarboxylate transporter receptor subunit TctC
VQIVPFNGTPALVAALLGGSVDAGVEILGPVRAQIFANRLRALAVMGSKRRADISDVPTVTESGIADFDVASWNALAAPARTPPDVIARLNSDINAALASPEVRAKLAELGVEARASSPESARELLTSEIRRWSEVIKGAGIQRQ